MNPSFLALRARLQREGLLNADLTLTEAGNAFCEAQIAILKQQAAEAKRSPQ